MDFHEVEIHDFLLDKYLQIIAKRVFRFLSSKVRRFTKRKESTKPPSYPYTGKQTKKNMASRSFCTYGTLRLLNLKTSLEWVLFLYVFRKTEVKGSSPENLSKFYL